MDDNFQPTVEVKGLDGLAETAKDIKNLEDIERFLEEKLNEKYHDTDYSFGYNPIYEINREKEITVNSRKKQMKIIVIKTKNMAV